MTKRKEFAEFVENNVIYTNPRHTIDQIGYIQLCILRANARVKSGRVIAFQLAVFLTSKTYNGVNRKKRNAINIITKILCRPRLGIKYYKGYFTIVKLLKRQEDESKYLPIS
jgi:hypothetical protein